MYIYLSIYSLVSQSFRYYTANLVSVSTNSRQKIVFFNIVAVFVLFTLIMFSNERIKEINGGTVPIYAVLQNIHGNILIYAALQVIAGAFPFMPYYSYLFWEYSRLRRALTKCAMFLIHGKFWLVVATFAFMLYLAKTSVLFVVKSNTGDWSFKQLH